MEVSLHQESKGQLVDSAPGRSLTVHAADGYALAACVYGPPRAERVVLISSATATPQRFYRRFAQALVAAGYAVVSYDYRGIGGSAPTSLRGFDARMRDWGLCDMPALVQWTRDQFPAAKLFLVGHSAGGQLAGLLEDSSPIAGMVTFSSQSGYYRMQGAEQKVSVGFHTHVTLPVLAQLFGYVPWSKLGSSEDLPKGVALEWSRWCRNPAYLLGDGSLPLDRYRRFRAPILAYSFADDKWGTASAVDSMMHAYPNVERRHVLPADVGLARIGHFGAFRAGAEPLWREVVEWLDAR